MPSGNNFPEKIAGIFFLLLSTGWAVGAAELGNGYLKYSPFMVVVALLFLGIGSYIIYRAGQKKVF